MSCNCKKNKEVITNKPTVRVTENSKEKNQVLIDKLLQRLNKTK